MALNQVTVTIDNAAPNLGTSLTPFWVGFHNGGFDTYDRGAPASPGLEQLAEDGNNNLISQEFTNSGFGNLDATIGSAPIAPGATVRQTFNVDASQGRYFNYASMI
ncbi:MAG TPA: CHRD domain-containing protein, partial [Cyanobacteria bacterium UBA11691]|nr:CHRD domain-containing protein [Cyanobacteria bacterium UBA11691]